MSKWYTQDNILDKHFQDKIVRKKNNYPKHHPLNLNRRSRNFYSVAFIFQSAFIKFNIFFPRN